MFLNSVAGCGQKICFEQYLIEKWRPGLFARPFLFIVSRPWRRRGSCGRKFFQRRRGNNSRVVALMTNDSLCTHSIGPFCHNPDMNSCNLLDFALSGIPSKNLQFSNPKFESRNRKQCRNSNSRMFKTLLNKPNPRLNFFQHGLNTL